MDLWRLHIFRKVVENEGFSKAANAINLSQPTVSSHIKDLERHYNCRLIDRLGKKVVPTKVGELLYYYAGRLLTLHAEAEAAMAEFHGKIKGRLVIGGSTIPGGYILPRVIGRFAAVYPDVRVALVVGDTEKIVREILDSVLEFGVVGDLTSDNRLEQTIILDDEMRLIIPADHKWAGRNSIGLDDLLQAPYIIRERGSGTLASIQKSFSQKGTSFKEMNIVAELGSTEAIIQGIKSGVGISILSPVAVAEELKAGTLKGLSIDGVNLKRKFYLTKLKDRSESPICKAFIQFMETSI